ncbi:MAG: DegV family protein [Ruminococcaceae bacterium]|nr:DegV family protein [Oscillospiraceae bacterium]
MNPYIIITDSSSDLPRELVEKYGLDVIQLTVTVEGEEPAPNDQIDPEEFYGKLRAKKSAKTSAVNLDTFEACFEKHLAAGTDVLYLGFSSGLSSTFNTGFVAAREMSEKYPERKCVAVDTLCASLGEGLLVVLAAKKKEEGATLEEVRDYVEQNKLNLVHLFTVDDLFFLKRGGRVSAITAVAGSALGIKPMMHVDNDGHLVKIGIKRGRTNSIDDLCARMQELAIDPAEQLVFISHGDCEDEAKYLAEKIKTTMGVKQPILISHVGPVIGAHSGPGTMALFFLGKER